MSFSLKRMEILTHAVIQMNLKEIILSEISQKRINIVYDFTYMVPKMVNFIACIFYPSNKKAK